MNSETVISFLIIKPIEFLEIFYLKGMFRMAFKTFKKLKPMLINAEKKKLTVWLAKVPKYLGEKIMSLKKEATIGTLSIIKDERGVSVEISLSELLTRTEIPTDHTIEIKDREHGMYVIENLPDEMSVEGVVNKECFIKPVINSKYLMYKNQLKKSQETENSSVKIIDYFSEVRKGEKYGSLRELDLLAKKRKRLLQDKKRERLDRLDVIDIIFNAFEKHDSWTVRDLADFSGQPVAYIQELVSEICVLNKKDHKNTYELKPEYKTGN